MILFALCLDRFDWGQLMLVLKEGGGVRRENEGGAGVGSTMEEHAATPAAQSLYKTVRGVDRRKSVAMGR